MARRKADVPVADDQPPKKRARRKKAVAPPACWEVCSKYVVKDGKDYVHICLGSTFVTLAELTRMMDGGASNSKENVEQ